ncbi:ABC transporter ATP-binding protein [bacterium]|nr:MAG: ABC transporter ATP-binding protein [bacterium]
MTDTMLSLHVRRQLPGLDVDVSLDVGCEVLVLAGRSGCGKTTTLNGLTGLIPLDDGRITLEGRTLYDHAARHSVPTERRGIGYLFQSYALFPHLDVAANVGYGLFASSAAQRAQRVDAMLERLGISYLRAMPTRTLSGGERQRVALARALVTEPRVLLLDEPLSALDVQSRAYVRSELGRILRSLTIPTIVVSHDIDDARFLGDRIAVMDAGHIVQCGSAEELAAQPATRFVAEFMGVDLVDLPAADGAVTQRIAFDPWRVRLSRERVNQRYAWRLRIVDIARIGGVVRLRLEGDVAIAAELPLEAWQSDPFSLDEMVYAAVHDNDVRSLSANSLA